MKGFDPAGKLWTPSSYILSMDLVEKYRQQIGMLSKLNNEGQELDASRSLINVEASDDVIFTSKLLYSSLKV